MPRFATWIVRGCALASLAGCSLRSVAYLSAETDAKDAGATAPDGAPAVPEGGPGNDATTDAGGDCPSLPGPRLVNVGAFCIDRTEVTIREYGQFLTAKGSDTTGQPAVCAGNTSYAPDPDFDVSDPEVPIAAIDWCDAYAYCAWAGKRLCGRIGGGAVPANELSLTDPTVDQWYFACSHDGEREYPYGNTYDKTACVGELGQVLSKPVATYPKCVGGFDGIFDMSGNVWEWEDNCDDAGTCTLRGGSREQGPVTLTCRYAKVGWPRMHAPFDTGIRCCTP